jgi:polysaccharide export outer membrane protein
MLLRFVVVVGLLLLGFSAPAASLRAQNPNPGGADKAEKAKDDGKVVAAERLPRYRIRRGDSFDVQFAYTPELNQSVAVEPDGFINLKNVGTVHVEGKTVAEVVDAIKVAYGPILHDPVITLALKDFDKPHVIVGGQVAKPGQYDLRSDITVTQAIQLAGGLTDAAKHSQVVLFRPVSQEMVEARLLDVKKMLNSRNVNEDVHLLPGDTIYVPQSTISKIRKYLPTQSVGLAVNTLPY